MESGAVDAELSANEGAGLAVGHKDKSCITGADLGS